MLRIALLAAGVIVDLWVWAVTATVNDLNVALNVIMILIAGAAAIPIVRSRRKDAAIGELETLVDAQKKYIEQRDRDLQGAIDRADRAEMKADQAKSKATYLEGRLHTAEEYSAPQAFERMTAHLDTLEHTMAEALRATGELALRNTAILATIAERLNIELPDEIKNERPGRAP